MRGNGNGTSGSAIIANDDAPPIIRRLRDRKAAADCPLSVHPARYVEIPSSSRASSSHDDEEGGDGACVVDGGASVVEICRFHNYDAQRGCLRSARARGRDDTMIGGGERGVRHGPHSLSQLRTEGTSRIGMSRCRRRRIVSRWHATRHGGRPVPHGSVRSDRRIVVLPSSSPSRRLSFAADHLDADARCDVGRHRRAGATRPGRTIARQDARRVRGVAPGIDRHPPPRRPRTRPPSISAATVACAAQPARPQG